MIEARTDIEPGNWQITATTKHCEYVEDFITIMVDSDWATRCAWFKRYKQRRLEQPKHKFRKEIQQKLKYCVGPDCPIAKQYRDDLIKDEIETKTRK